MEMWSPIKRLLRESRFDCWVGFLGLGVVKVTRLQLLRNLEKQWVDPAPKDTPPRLAGKPRANHGVC